MKSLRRIAALVLAVLLSLCACSEGLIDVTLSDDCFVKPDERDLTVRVSKDITKVEVRTESGKKLMQDTDSGVFRISVTKETLDAGQLTFDVICYVNDEASVNHVSIPVKTVEDFCEGKLYIVFPDRTLTEGETVPVRYELMNSGKIRFSKAVLITEDGEEIELTDIPAQSTADITRYVTVSKDKEYTLSGRVFSPYTGKITELVKVSVTPEFAYDEVILTQVCENLVPMGQYARMTINIENRGNVTYHGCSLYCNGIFAASDLPDVLRPGDFITLNLTTPIIDEDTTFDYTLSLTREDGIEVMKQLAPFTVGAEKNEEILQTLSENNCAGDGGNFIRNTVLFLVGLDAIGKSLLIGCGVISAVLISVLLISKKRKPKEDGN